MQASSPESIQITKIAGYKDGYGREIGFHRSGTRWASASTGILHIWEGSTLVNSVSLPGYVYGSVQFSDDAHKVYVGPWIVDTEDYNTTFMLPDQDALVAAIDSKYFPRSDLFSPLNVEWSRDKKILVVLTKYRPPRRQGDDYSYDGPEGQLLVMEPVTQKVEAVLEEDCGFITDRAITISQHWIAAGSQAISVWDFPTGKRLINIADNRAYCNAIRFSPDETYLAGIRVDGTIGVWTTKNWLPYAEWQGHAESGRAIAFHPRLPFLVSGGDDQQVKLWALASSQPELVSSVSVGNQIEGAVFHPVERHLYVSAWLPSEEISIFEIIL